jgi:hypothetical protein
VKGYIGAAIAVATFFTQTAYTLELKDPFETSLGRQYRAEIEVLAISPEYLPSTCHLAREVRTAPIFPATTNPFVTDDAQLIEFVSQIGFGSQRLHDISVAFSALFYETEPRHEVGVWALRFKSPQAASRAQRSMTRKFFAKGSMVAHVWRDDETGRTCQKAIDAHLIKKGFATFERTP